MRNGSNPELLDFSSWNNYASKGDVEKVSNTLVWYINETNNTNHRQLTLEKRIDLMKTALIAIGVMQALTLISFTLLLI